MSLTYDLPYGYTIDKHNQYDKVMAWCKTQFGQEYNPLRGTGNFGVWKHWEGQTVIRFMFRDKADATLFYLTWIAGNA